MDTFKSFFVINLALAHFRYLFKHYLQVLSDVAGALIGLSPLSRFS
jgi:hypothetical protein